MLSCLKNVVPREPEFYASISGSKLGLFDGSDRRSWMRCSRWVRAAVGVVAVACACGAGVRAKAQTAAARVGVIDASARVVLHGSVLPRAAAATDLGAADASQQLPLMALRFQMTAAQQAALRQLLEAQQNPASAEYHRWLTPEQFGARFGLAPEDLATVAGWLRAQGFAVTAVARGGLFVQFSGTVGQAERAFGAQMENVLSGGERHVANVTEASLPAAIAAVTAGITGLDDFRPEARVSARTVAAAGAGGAGSASTEARPEYTVPSGSQAGSHYLAPGDFYTIYDETPVLASGYMGFGIGIAVVGQTDIHASDLAAFQSAAGLANNPATVMLSGADPGTTSADLLEAETMLEWADAAAPRASLVYVNSVNAMNGSLTLAIDDDVAPIVADGYGQCEASLGVAAIVYYNQMLQQAAAEGITIVAAAGNDGATGCDTNDASATQGLAVDFPASSPYVTAVGGTEFNEGGGNYWAASNGAYGGSAVSYLPETAWNDDGASGLAAGGGGGSGYFAKPSWQTGAGVPADFSRDVPDVALSASMVHDGYLVCVAGSCANGFASASGTVEVTGGTQAASAGFAGVLALVEDKVENPNPLTPLTNNMRLGVANPVLYALANSSYAGNVFHDVTTGTNASPCTAASTGCGASGTIGFAATAGYDRATGWGSVDAANLVNDWGKVTALATSGGTVASVTNVAASASPVSAGTSVMLTATVASAVSTSTTTPTGSVQFAVDGVAVGTAVALTSGTATYSLATGSLSVGSHTVQATYLGDATYAGSKAAFALSVTAAQGPDFSLTPATASVTVAAGGIAPGVVFTVTAIDGFAGSVQFTATAPTTLGAQYSFSVNPVTLSANATTGTTLLELLAYTPAAQTGRGVDAAQTGRAAGAGVALAGLLLLVLPRRRRFGSLGVVCALGVALTAAIGLAGCGGPRPAPPVTTGNVPAAPGTYAVTIAGTGMMNGVTTTHSSVVTLVVQ